MALIRPYVEPANETVLGGIVSPVITEREDRNKFQLNTKTLLHLIVYIRKNPSNGFRGKCDQKSFATTFSKHEIMQWEPLHNWSAIGYRCLHVGWVELWRQKVNLSRKKFLTFIVVCLRRQLPKAKKKSHSERLKEHRGQLFIISNSFTHYRWPGIKQTRLVNLSPYLLEPHVESRRADSNRL